MTKTTCPYCGVGCGVLASHDGGGAIKIEGDPLHPANFGRLCSKGAALGQTVGLDGRILAPEINGAKTTWEAALDYVADGFRRTLRDHGPEAVAFYVSGQLLTEDYYVANKLMKGFLGAGNIDTNSRLCMSSAVAAHKRAFGTDTVPCCYDDLERAKLIVLVGSNTAWCHPVLFQRINKAKETHPDLAIVVIDPRRTATCEIADLHLPLRAGTDAVLFNGLLNYLEQCGEVNRLFLDHFTEGADAALDAARQQPSSVADVAQKCGVALADVQEFFRLFARTERVVTVFSQGVNQSSSGTDKGNAIINCHLLTGRIGRPGMGPFSFTGQPNAMGGREVGGLANQLAAHLEIDNPAHRDKVRRFWQAPNMTGRAGLKAVDLFRAVATGKVKAIWIMGTNPVVSMPDADAVRSALAQCDMVVTSDCVRATDTTAVSHVLLPALAWGEKDGTVTNSERRISRQRAFLPAPGEAKADWWIICEVAKRLGFADAFAYSSPLEIFREHAQLSGYENDGERDFDISYFADITATAYEEFPPVQWPVTATHPGGTARLFADGRFYTPSRRARFVAVTPRAAANPTDDDFPFVLNTGRVRDQWHTMTRTGKAPRLSEHNPEPYAELHPDDANAVGVADGALLRVFSRWGEAILRTQITTNVRRGNIFVPIHWNDQFASHGRVGALINDAVDPISGQPEFKHTPVRVVPYSPSWHGFLLSRRQVTHLQPASYWARTTADGFFRYELAGEQPPEDWPAWARRVLCQSDDDVNWVEYLDKAARRYRGVRMVGGRVESCVFIAPSHALPPRTWLAGLFGKPQLSDGERTSLLTGRAPTGQIDTGPVVCACFSIGLNTLVDAIKTRGLTSPAAIGQALKAGTNCGSCIPELKALISKHGA
jgi:assimilatory nitrate reductase catalytic subunit